MEYSEIVLIAFILLAVFAAAQLEKFFVFLRGTSSVKQKDAVAPKTVLTMDELPPIAEKKEAVATVEKKAVVSKPKKVSVKSKKTTKKTVAKKTTKKKIATKTKKKSSVKKAVELPSK